MRLEVNKSYIYHYFPGQCKGLCLSMIRAFWEYSKEQNYFIVVTYNQKDAKEYCDLFKKLNCKRFYIFVYGCEKNKINDRIIAFTDAFFHRIKGFPLREQYRGVQLNTIIRQLNGCRLLLHGEIGILGKDIFNAVRKIDISKVTYVNWGEMPSKCLVMQNDALFKYNVLDVLAHCASIHVLTTPDKRQMAEEVSNTPIFVTPYFGRDDTPTPHNKKEKKILVGNSGLYTDSYIDAAERLKNIEGLSVTFMLNYGITKQDKEKFKEKCLRIAPKLKISFWEDCVDFENYKKIVNSYSVYICAAQRQTGLGAISVHLQCQNKLYLNGVNYDFMKELGYNVHHIEELDTITQSSQIFEYENKDADYNHKLFYELNDCQNLSTRWDFIIKNKEEMRDIDSPYAK